MNELSLTTLSKGESQSAATGPPCSRPLLLRLAAWCLVAAWRTCVDWRTKRPFLTRATAHLSMIVLALVAIYIGGVGLPAPRAAVGGSLDANIAFSAAGGASIVTERTPSPTPSTLGNLPRLSDTDTVARLPVPYTTIPERPRAQVAIYTIQSGDTLFDVANRFGLSPETLVWSNLEAIQDAPWLIQPGMELYILPVDGVYHTVAAGETVESIAAKYEVDPAAMYNEWNALEEGGQSREGQLLVVPGGKGTEVDWTPPPLYPDPGPAWLSYGVCNGVGVTGAGATGSFIYPTGSSRVSGWYFHDARNPTHIGLDYACRTGDPIYAADNGVVVRAGWNGGYGIMIELDHGNGFVTRYGHFSELAVGCGAVYQGTLLGYCGSTGYSSGAHLHLEIRYNGSPQDPQIYLP